MYTKEPNYEAYQEIVNQVNVKERHCRIGKVRQKTGVPWFDKPSVLRDIMKRQSVIPSPFMNSQQPKWMQGKSASLALIN